MRTSLSGLVLSVRTGSEAAAGHLPHLKTDDGEFTQLRCCNVAPLYPHLARRPPRSRHVEFYPPQEILVFPISYASHIASFRVTRLACGASD
jgi:hypothetical protein